MKKTVAKYLCIILSVAMLVTALPLTVYAEDSVINVSTAEQLSAACTAINNGNGGEYTINLTGDIIDGQIDITKSGAVVTVIGNGKTITNDRTAVYVSDGAKVILGDGKSDLILKGTDTFINGVTNDCPGLIDVLPDSTCEMNKNVTVKDRKGQNYLGAGATVEGGTFVMNGGIIDNCGIDGGSVCYGGGVAVFNGGYFEMNGGTIKNCYVKSIGNSWQIPFVAGGGVFVNCASFKMNGGTIEKCTATNYDTSEETDAIGGGVAVITSIKSVYDNRNYGHLDSDFTMNGGTIKSCSSTIGGGALAAGMAYANYEPMLTHAYHPHSGSESPGIFLNGGSMIGNKTNEGGAIFFSWIRESYPVIVKNMSIDSNHAYTGGAIEVTSYWTAAKIEKCNITNNTATSKGGAIMLLNNSSSSGTYIKDTTIKNNTSGDRGAGVYYDSNSQLTISGANIIQDNYYNNVLNNLNIFSKAKPVYVNGDLTGSKVGLSDSTLWDDGKEDTDPEAVSTGYLTSGYKNYNSNLLPSAAFTSDHESWLVDYSDTNINEVRLVRKKPNYHINNDEIDDNYNNNDIFTSYVEAATKEIKVGDTIEEFYTIPEVTTTKTNSCPYIFKGWYYDKDNDIDTHPVTFGTDKYSKDIYAHWIKVEDVAKDEEDDNELPSGYSKYGGFDLAGVQVREGIKDTNFGYEKKPGGLRFVTSLNMDVVNQINAIKPNNIEYGYVAATNKGWIDYHSKDANANRKLQYASTNTNGIDTSSDKAANENYFGFASNIDCTSRKTNGSGKVNEDHRNFNGYLLYTLVITYENVEDEESAKNTKVLARPYIKYLDANGLERVAYSEYRGTNILGGCYTSYNAIAGNN